MFFKTLYLILQDTKQIKIYIARGKEGWFKYKNNKILIFDAFVLTKK